KDERLFVPVIGQDDVSSDVWVGDGLLVVEAEKNVTTISWAAAYQAGTLPPCGERPIVKRRIVVLQMKVNARDLMAAVRPRAGDVRTVIDDVGHGSALESLATVLRDTTGHFLRRRDFRLRTGGVVHGLNPTAGQGLRKGG